MNPEWRTRYEAAVDVAGKAGALALQYYDTELGVEWKADASPVTVADREAEALLRTTLLGHFPRDAFLGEESGEQPGDSGFRWVIDPIDGTRSFMRGIPLWGMMIGLEYKGEQIAGVVNMPALGHLYRALRGGGAYRGERRLRVSDATTLDQATTLYTSVSWFRHPGSWDAFLRVKELSQLTRGFGDVYGYLLVAQGSAELMVEHGVHPWDVAAARALVEEAGGRMTDWSGRVTIQSKDSLASNGNLHDAALRALSWAPPET